MARLSVGLALSGGTAKAVTHVGVLKALVEENIPIDCLAGTSGGSIVGAMYASGVPLSSLEEIATTMSWRKLVSIKLTRLGFISSGRIEEFVTDIIGDISFEDLIVPYSVVATNLITGSKRAFSSGPVARAVRASCSIPQIYLPVEIDGQYYVDGGLAEYLPVETVAAMGGKFIIASHLGPVEDAYRRPHHILQLVIQVTGLMARKNYVISMQKADILVHPNLDRFGSFDFDNSDKMIELGYDTAKALIDELRQKWRKKNRFWYKIAGKIRRTR